MPDPRVGRLDLGAQREERRLPGGPSDQADTDRDGALTPAEFLADHMRFFRRLDVDGDGRIDNLETNRYEREVAPEILSAVDRGDRMRSGGGGKRGGRGGMGMLCDPRAAGMAEWRMERIERVVQPTEAQRAALNDLRTASTKAAEQIAAACPREFPASASARMELMEKRLETMLAAMKTVRPAFDAFYATLSAEQKAKLDQAGPRRWGWRHWGWRN